VLLNDEDITRMPMYRRARRGIGYLAQEPSAFQKLTVAENIRLVLEMQPTLSREERSAREERLIADLGLTEHRDFPTPALSGGLRRRTEIARVLATEPSFILLDEPFTGVDPIAIADLRTIIADLKKRDIGVLITDHNVHAMLKIVDRAYIISEGEMKTAGTPQQLAVDPIARKYYLGESWAAEAEMAAP
jgi:lipopolysaccharide export system ATP-binding protein